MLFSIYGPFEVRRKNGLVDSQKSAKEKFWKIVNKKAPGLSEASGCYLFLVNSKTPWYVGKAERQSFEREVFSDHKLKHYNEGKRCFRPLGPAA